MKFKNISKLFLTIIILVIGIYLILPSPNDPPSLPNSFKSIEPGDTGQIPGLFAYYTNMSRQEVVNFYKSYYLNSSFLKIPLLTYKLNHPPEYSYEVIRDTNHSSFIEEFVHPLRESLFLSGYEPANDPFNKTGQKYKDFEIDGKTYSLKISIYRKESNPISRLIIFIGILACTYLLMKLTPKVYEDFRNNR